MSLVFSRSVLDRAYRKVDCNQYMQMLGEINPYVEEIVVEKRKELRNIHHVQSDDNEYIRVIELSIQECKE